MNFVNFFKVNLQNIRKISKLAALDLKKIYAGSFLGFIWVLLRHIIVVFVFWFTFYVGLRGNNYIEGYPYLIWLIVGLTPWFYIADGLNQGATTFIKKAYIVKKIKYKIETLPMTTIFTFFISHLFFLGVTLSLLIAYGFFPAKFNIMLPYYTICLFLFLWAVSILTSSLSTLIRDVPYFVQSITSALLWLSPILWPFTNLPENLQKVMMFNPIFYIVNGYRNALLYGNYDLMFSTESIIFWVELLVIFLIGIRSFYKLKPVLSDLI
ncbi:ABC transporter permease [Haloplasma contractile]|uniref:Transport permease protein n=1 Tax=Haloplasma contractile SSD-17B TaxID=1033810 RepID=U2FIK3_9MOLU|nr:ABC transporter permease [Haloplasma contractile]ERJ11059.1 Teichoic acid translocation permease protein TagG [Haloplasma contractile SSD-17B]